MMAKPAFDENKPFESQAKPSFDPNMPFQPTAGPGVLDKAKTVAGAVAKGLDYAFGAAPRAALGAAAEGKNPLSAFVEQYGKSPEEAPTGRQVAVKFGASEEKHPVYMGKGGRAPEDLSTADWTGEAIDLGANLLNLAPVAKLAGSVKLPAAVSEAVATIKEIPGNLATKGASLLTGKSKEAIKVYAQRGDEVKDLITKFGGELPEAADAMKQKVLSSISETKKGLNEAITTDLAKNKAIVEVNPIIEKLQEARLKLNPHYHAGDIAQIDEMITAVQNTAIDGKMVLKDLFETKKFLQTRSQGAFVKNGELFSSGAEAQKAANSARKLAADSLHKASPEIAHADEVFTSLHDLDDKMSASLLGTGKAENVFASAGGGKGNVHQVNLRKVGEITGTTPLADAELLHAAKAFKDPDTRATLLRILLDAKRNTGAAFGAVPTGSSTAIDNLLQILSKGESARVPAQTEGNAMQRRMQNSK